MPLKRVVAVLFLMLLPVIGAAGKDSEAAVNSAVEKTLRQQESAWNRHDLDGFMTGYWNSSDLTFFRERRSPQAGSPLWSAIVRLTRAKAARWGSWNSPIFESSPSNQTPPLSGEHGI